MAQKIARTLKSIIDVDQCQEKKWYLSAKGEIKAGIYQQTVVSANSSSLTVFTQIESDRPLSFVVLMPIQE